MLSRAEFLLLTDLTRPRFDARARRDQFPFLVADEYDGVQGRRLYTAGHALLTVVVEDLARKGGLDLDLANEIGLNCQHFLFDADLSDDSKPIWVGAAFWDENGTIGRNHVGGTIEAVDTQLKRDPDTTPLTFRVVLANATRAAAIVRRRAQDHRIELGPFF
ncbi:hypothetical protein [Microvirga sp. P5_D2]